MKKLVACLILFSFALPSHAFFWNKKYKALEKELQGKGYAGNLPNLNKNTEKTKTKVTTPIFESQEGFDNPADLKPVQRDNPAFINIIQKKDNTSQYVNDANEVITMLENLVDSIEDDYDNLELFTTRANVVSTNIDNLSEKYNGKPVSYYESFKKLLEVNRYIKSIALLRREAVTYQRYLAYTASGSIYNPENIANQLQYLLEEINSTILMLREEN